MLSIADLCEPPPPSFTIFSKLPTELRLEIWRHHFLGCHGTQMHIFKSSPGGLAHYMNQDAATGEPAYDTLPAATTCSEALAVFRSLLFTVGNTQCLQPQSHLLDASGRLIDHHQEEEILPNAPCNNLIDEDSAAFNNRALYAHAARAELSRRTEFFALGPDDVIYIVDEATTEILSSLCTASWLFPSSPFQKEGGEGRGKKEGPCAKRRIALQILDFAAPAVPRDRTITGIWARWRGLLDSPSPGMRRLFGSGGGGVDSSRERKGKGEEEEKEEKEVKRGENERGRKEEEEKEESPLESLLFVIVPNPDYVRARNPRPNTYGFVVIDPDDFSLGSDDDAITVRRNVYHLYNNLCRTFPNLASDGKISCVADVVPNRDLFGIRRLVEQYASKMF